MAPAPTYKTMVALVLLLAQALSVLGQTCEIWDGYPSGCSGYTGFGAGTPIFVPAGMTLSQMQGIVTTYVGTIKYVVERLDCMTRTIGAICTSWLRPCALNGSVAFPVEPCITTCVDWVAVCSTYQPIQLFPIQLLGCYVPPGNGPFLTCNETDPDANNQSLWAQGSTTLQLTNGTDLELPCVPSLDGNPYDFRCHDPLIDFGVRCAFTCPLPSYTDSEYESAQDMQNVVAWISWAGTSVLITSLLLFPPARSFPKVLILLISVAANLATGALLLPTFAGYTETWCGGSGVTIVPTVALNPSLGPDGTLTMNPHVAFDANELTVKSSLCTFQGAMLQFGYLASTFWWAIIAFNMALELLLGSIMQNREMLWKILRLVVYNVIGWGLSFFLMLIPASADKIGFAPGATYCFVTEEDDLAWILTFFFIPVGLSLLIGVSCSLIALVKIAVVAIRLRKWTMIFQYFRLALFIFIFLFIYTFIFAYYITIADNKNEIVDGYGDYFSCLANPVRLSDGSGTCSLSESVSNYGLAMMRGFAICSLGWLLFFNFMTWELMLQWYAIFKGLYIGIIHRDPNPLKTALRSGSTTRRLSTTLVVSKEGDGAEDIPEGAEDEEMDSAKGGSSSSSDATS